MAWVSSHSSDERVSLRRNPHTNQQFVAIARVARLIATFVP
jgi:hypothetical protein